MAVTFDTRKGSDIVAEELVKLKEAIAANMYAEGAVATGNTIRSMKVITEEYGARLVTTGRMPFGVLETGRKKGKVPRGFDAIIYEWMQVKGVHATDVTPYRGKKYGSAQERADWSMAAAIAHVIHKGSRERPQGGTLLNRMGGRNNIYSNVIPQAVQAITNKIRPFIEVAAVESIKLNIKDLKNQ